MGFKLHSSSV